MDNNIENINRNINRNTTTTKILFLLLIIALSTIVLVAMEYQKVQNQCNNYWRNQLIEKKIIKNETSQINYGINTNMSGYIIDFNLSTMTSTTS